MAGCLQGWISIGFQRQVLPQVGVIKKESPVTPKRQGFFGQAERALYHPYQSLALSRVLSFGKWARMCAAAFSFLPARRRIGVQKLPLDPPHKGMRSYYTRCETKGLSGNTDLLMDLCSSIIHCFHLFVNLAV